MKTHSREGKELGNLELPEQFKEPYHPNLIRRAVLSEQLSSRQPYGAFPEAGKRASVRISKRRRDYRTSYGHGIARTPRKVVWHRGRQFGWVGAFSPNTRKGRRSHPPKAEKVLEVKINKKERNKAIRSALSAAINKEIVKLRNHVIPSNYPFFLESSIESISKTKDAEKLLLSLGLEKELARASVKKVRAGKGKNRGRKYRKKTGPLIVVSQKCSLLQAGKNIPGVDTAIVDKSKAEQLAPGTHAGRLTIFTESAIEKLRKERLFT